MSRRKEQSFGDYTLVERIARGGMAEIFLARTRGFRGFEKSLVIKRLHPHYSDDEQFIRMLVDEAKIAVQLQHANIVQIFDLGQVHGQYYIAMEYIRGLDLFRVLRELHDRDLVMPVEAAAFIASELCHGLHYAHTRRDQHSGEPLQVIHRDVSPQNVLLSWAGEVKLTDFGIVKAAHRSTHTQAGVIKGKFYYMSPEQARGQQLDYRSDIFSAGIVLYEALTACPLYVDADDAELLQRVQRADISSPRELRPDIPEALDAICMKALAPEREDRYQSAVELARALTDFIASRGRAFTKLDLSDFLRSLFRDEPAAADSGVAPGAPAVPPPIPAAALPVGDDEDLVIEDPNATVALDLRSGRDAHAITTETPGPAFAEPPGQKTVGARPDRMPAAAAGPSAEVERLPLGLAPLSADAPKPPARVVTPLPPVQGPPPRVERSVPRADSRPPASAGPARSDSRAPATGPARTTSRPPARTSSQPPTRTASSAGVRGPIAAPSLRRGGTARVAPPPALAAEPTDARHEDAHAQTQRLSLADIRARDAALRGHAPALTAQTVPPLIVEAGPAAKRRERRLKVALGVVGAAIVVVSASILWLLTNPVQPPPARATPTPRAGPAKTAPPKAKTPRSTVRKAAAPQIREAGRTGTIVFAPPEGTQAYRLYVNGELAEPTNDRLDVSVGRHTIRARLMPRGTMTDEQVVEVRPGRTVHLKL